MLKKERKTSKGLIAILIIAYLFFAIFAAGLVWFGLAAAKTADTEINGGLLGFVKYTFADPALFFTFKVKGLIRILQIILPGLFYAFVFIFVLYFIVGIIVGAKKHRGISAPALIAVFLSVVAYFIAATDASKFLAVIANVDPLKDAGAMMVIPSVLILFSIVFFILFSYIAFFMSLVEAIKNPRVEPKPVEENASEQATQAEENQQVTKAEVAYTEGPVMFEPVDESAIEFEPLPEPEAPAEEKAEEAAIQEEPKEEKSSEEKDDLKSLLREVVRDIVRDEIARNNANQPRSDFNPLAGGSITGATFGGPLVVQYFNGGINSPTAAQAQPAEPVPAPQPEPKAEPQPAPAPVEEKPEPQPVEEEPVADPEPEPVVEEPVQEEPQPEEAPVEEVVEPVEEQPVEEAQPEEAPAEEVQPEQPAEEPAQEPVEEQPVVEAAPEAPVEEKKPIIRIPFTERMINADEEMQNNYNELKNEILSYGVNSRVSNSGDTFRLHRVTYVKITIAGLSLKLYFALNPDDYKDSTLPIQNAGHKGIYAEIPLVFKVKSGLSMRRCKQLIQDLMDKNGLEQGEIKDINWVEQLKNEPEGESEE